MKIKSYFLCVFLVVLSTLVHGQIERDTLVHKPGGLWVSIKNNDIFNPGEKGRIMIKNKKVNDVFVKYNIKTIKKYHKNSNDKALNEVYEIHCDCNEFKLMQELKQLHEFFNYIELIPKNEIEYKPPILGFTPNDYSEELLWFLNKIEARRAWEISKNYLPVKIAITDNGFDPLHEDLLDNIIYEHGNVWHIDTSLPHYSHGTCVSGLAAMTTDNIKGYSSIGGLNSKLMLYKGLNYSNIKAAADDGARVINASWSGSLYSTINQNDINYAYNKGAVIVAAASTTDYCKYPACYDNVIAVAGTNLSDIKFHGSGHYPEVDVSAPAENLVCPIVGGSHDEYSFTSGWTSGAAALVTGLCGMIISIHPDLTPEEVEYILKSTADPIDHLPGNSLYIGRLGAGRINAYRAVLCSKKLSEPIILSGGISGSYEKYHVNITHGVSTGDINIKTKDLTINGPFEAGLNNSLIIDNDFIINCN